MAEIAPSILSADFTCLGEQLALVERAGASYIHVDVMDGHFVPNITIGPFIVKWVRQATSLPIDAHLMIEHPDDYIPQFARAGANMISVHPETTYHLHRTLKAGLVLNPATPLDYVEEMIHEIDYVLLMSVNPGFGGQKFISTSLDKLRRLRGLIRRLGRDVRIEIDGGIGPENAAEVVEAGAEILVAGTAVFGTPDPAQALRELARAADARAFV
jgi:ribulose-phosphate 3-epimerase